MKELGKNQIGFLRAVELSGRFVVGGGWIWRNKSTSEKLANSLVSRGFLVRTREPWGHRSTEHDVWRVTEAGRRFLASQGYPVSFAVR